MKRRVVHVVPQVLLTEGQRRSRNTCSKLIVHIHTVVSRELDHRSAVDGMGRCIFRNCNGNTGARGGFNPTVSFTVARASILPCNTGTTQLGAASSLWTRQQILFWIYSRATRGIMVCADGVFAKAGAVVGAVILDRTTLKTWAGSRAGGTGSAIVAGVADFAIAIGLTIQILKMTQRTGIHHTTNAHLPLGALRLSVTVVGGVVPRRCSGMRRRRVITTTDR